MANVEMIGRLLVSLAAVLGVMWLIAKRVKRGAAPKNTRLIDVLGRQQLSRNASVAVIRVLDQAVIVGVTDGQVNVLGEADLAAAEALAQAADAAKAGRKKRSLGGVAALAARAAQPAAAQRAAAQRAAAAYPAAGYVDDVAPQQPRATRQAPAASRTTAAQARAAQALAAQALAAAQAARAGEPAARFATRERSTSPLAGSALSPQTWRQTVESLRDLTSRTS